jgi:hypothetical protein
MFLVATDISESREKETRLHVTMAGSTVSLGALEMGQTTPRMIFALPILHPGLAKPGKAHGSIFL